MIIAYDNLLKNATLSATNEHSSYPIENVFHQWKKRVFRTTDGEYTTTITIDFGAIEQIKSLFVMYHNASDIEVRFYDGGLVDTWTDFVKHKAVSASVVEIDLTAPVELYVGLIFIGDSLYYKKSAEQDMPLSSTDVPTFSSDGQVAGREGSVLRGGTVEVPFLTADEREAFEGVFYHCGMIKPFFLDLWDKPPRVFEPAYGVFVSQLGVTHLEEGDTITFDFTEVN